VTLAFVNNGFKSNSEKASQGRAMMEIGTVVSDTVHGEDLFKLNRLDQADALRTEGHLLFAERDFQGAESKYWKALALAKEALGPYHLQIAEQLDELAELYELRDNKPEALRFFQFAHTVKEKLLGTQHPVVMRSGRKIAKLQTAPRELAVAS
jgi:tetratricopeptide (TPR) repeat protein